MSRIAAEQRAAAPVRKPAWRPGRRGALVGLGAVVVLAIVGLAIYSGDLPEVFGGRFAFLRPVLRGTGWFGAYGLLYAEESGVPMPMPGDVFVMYIGHHAPHHVPTLVAAWLALIGVVVLGATNLFWLSRRFGRSLVEKRLARVAHLTPERMVQAEAWFGRWGAWSLIVGRHVPGLRIPLTVGAGIFGVGYRTFVLSVIISTAIWAGFFIIVGAAFGGRVQHLLNLHRSLYVWIPVGVVVAFVGYFGYRFWHTRER